MPRARVAQLADFAASSPSAMHDKQSSTRTRGERTIGSGVGNVGGYQGGGRVRTASQIESCHAFSFAVGSGTRQAPALQRCGRVDG